MTAVKSPSSGEGIHPTGPSLEAIIPPIHETSKFHLLCIFSQEVMRTRERNKTVRSGLKGEGSRAFLGRRVQDDRYPAAQSAAEPEGWNRHIGQNEMKPAERAPCLSVLRGFRWRLLRWKTNMYLENKANGKQGPY